MERYGTEDETEIARIFFEQIKLMHETHPCRWEGCFDPKQEEPKDNEKKLVFSSLKLLAEHILNDHYIVDFVCRWPSCPRKGNKLDDNVTWSHHVCGCLGYDPHVCGICKRSFVAEKLYFEHMAKHSTEKKNDYWESRKAAESPFQPPPPVIRQLNTDSVIRFRKIFRRATGGSHHVCLHYTCNKFVQSSMDYCGLHTLDKNIIWDILPPCPLYHFQDPTTTTEGDFYWRREKLSDYDGQWKKLCAREDCFMPLNRFQPPFCSQKCKKEYEWKLKLQEEGAAAAALLPGHSVQLMEVVNLSVDFYGPRLERLNDPLVKNMKHVKFRLGKSGWAPLCHVAGCNILEKACRNKGDQHKESPVKVPNSPLLIFKDDYPVHTQPIDVDGKAQWPPLTKSLPTEFWVRRRWNIEKSK